MGFERGPSSARTLRALRRIRASVCAVSAADAPSRAAARIAPGIVRTLIMKGLAEELAENAGKPAEWGWEQFTKDISLGRLSESEDVAKIIGFLAGPDSDYITGQTIIVDGGMVFH
ncbi:SDR family oxidoreductase [Corynebacterium striatum]|uniref:SDR family oxidoreductase n=1 Tax=Corynebacterium striatum TaxID=43770 RepID=UPI001F2ADD24|nr:SDR family oxidoreductase [Corynebacterium striatum]